MIFSAVLTLCFLYVSVSCGTVVEKRQVTSSCPAGWKPSPCVCESIPNSRFASVNCDAATEPAQLQGAFASLPSDASFGTFSLSGSNVTSLPSGVFGRASFQFFFITNSKLETVGDDAFKGSESTAENFLLHNNSFQAFNFQSLRNLANLRNFELSNDNLSSIPDNAFGRKNKLEVLNLGGNKISSLGKNAFAELPKLTKIDLTGNLLTKLGELSLTTPASQGPVTFLLSHNQISEIDKQAFNETKLYNMEIEDNKLETLKEEVFRPLLESASETKGSIGTLGNPFKCDKDSVKWLLELREELKSHLYGFMCRDGRAFQQLKASDLS